MTFEKRRTEGHISNVDDQWSVFVDGTYINTFDNHDEALKVCVFLQQALDYARGY